MRGSARVGRRRGVVGGSRFAMRAAAHASRAGRGAGVTRNAGRLSTGRDVGSDAGPVDRGRPVTGIPASAKMAARTATSRPSANKVRYG